MTTPPTSQQLDDIETRANAATPGPWEEHTPYGPDFYAYLRGPYLRGVGTLNFGDGEDAAADREFVKHAREDVDVLLAEVRRFRAAAETFRAEFGNRAVKSRYGDDWVNIADWFATGARIPACGAFYPPAVDTRCYLAKGHRRSHLAEWGTRDMAWPYDPRETVQPAEETHVGADDSDDPEHVDDCPGCPSAAAGSV
jgi:hypothetical protein